MKHKTKQKESSPPQPKERLEASLRDVAESQGIVGMTISVVRPDQPTWTTSIGHADLARDRVTTSDTRFMWFSMTKIVTSTAVMQLVERGLVGLDDPVVDHLPAFGHLGHRRATTVTVRHLLSHSAGLANPIPVRWVHPATATGPNPTEFLDRQLRRHRRLRFEPGTEARYTNLGYLVLGQLVAQTTGMSFVDHVTRSILEPLGMADTYFGAPRPNEATVYQSIPRAATPLLRLALPRGTVNGRTGRWLSYRPFRVNGAAYGGLVGTAVDAAKFLRIHLPQTAAEAPPPLNADTIAEMQRITTPGKPYDHGLGWFRPVAKRQTQPRFIEHLGGGLGVYNTMRIYPDLGASVVIMSNTPGYDLDTLLTPLVAAMT